MSSVQRPNRPFQPQSSHHGPDQAEHGAQRADLTVVGAAQAGQAAAGTQRLVPQWKYSDFSLRCFAPLLQWQIHSMLSSVDFFLLFCYSI